MQNKRVRIRRSIFRRILALAAALALGASPAMAAAGEAVEQLTEAIVPSPASCPDGDAMSGDAYQRAYEAWLADRSARWEQSARVRGGRCAIAAGSCTPASGGGGGSKPGLVSVECLFGAGHAGGIDGGRQPRAVLELLVRRT